MSATDPIGVFDSGIGGLTVVRSIIDRLPQENLVYFGDTARVPYGSKSAQVVCGYSVQIARFLLTHRVKAIVIACNTATAAGAVPALQAIVPRTVPVIGVIEPGARAAVGATRNRRVGVIGTLGTVASKAYETAIARLNSAVTVVSQPCPLFVPLAEEGWTDHPATRLIAAEYLTPVLRTGIDTLVMGCTHYPVLEPAIARQAGSGVTLVHVGVETAATLADTLAAADLLNPSATHPNRQFFVSDVPHRFREVGERFLGRSLGKVETYNW